MAGPLGPADFGVDRFTVPAVLDRRAEQHPDRVMMSIVGTVSAMQPDDYLVGTYREVSEIVARYIQVGFTTFITDIPPDKEELFHQKIVFELASLQVRGAAPGAQAIQSGANR